MTESLHLTTKELAERWAVTPGHLINQRSLGEGAPYIKFGSRVLYRRTDIEQYEADRFVPTSAAR